MLLLKFEDPIAQLFVGLRTYPLQCDDILNCPCVLPICKQTK